MIRHRRTLLIAVAFGIAVALAAPARANLQTDTGIRYVEQTGSVADCGTKVKAALAAYLQNPTETPVGSGDWIAFAAADADGNSSAAAVGRCTAVGSGYVVTFTCSVEFPGSPYTAHALCIDIAHTFSGKQVTALATPTPVPTGCTTANLVGTWVSNNTAGLSFTMDAQGNVTDNQGVSGSWELSGTTAKLTYYGFHTLTLSADGKHLTGSGYDLTRKC